MPPCTLQLHYIYTERVTAAGKLLTCIREMCLVRVPAGTPLLSLLFITVLFSSSSKCRDSAWNISRPLPSRLFPIHRLFVHKFNSIQNVPEGKVSILGGHSIGHSKQKSVYAHVSYSEQFPRLSYFTVQLREC
jgi:hypothetical protein